MWAAFIKRLAIFLSALLLGLVGIVANTSGPNLNWDMVFSVTGVGLFLIWGCAWVLGGFRS